MQTNFPPQQLKDPHTAEVDRILRRCVHCGFCTATCPTYVLMGDERDSPRGRIYLMKEMFERGKKATPVMRTHIDRCLSCLSCMTTCPSGVDYMHLVDHARAHVNDTSTRGLKDRLIRNLLAATLPYPRRMRLALQAARLARPFAGFLQKILPKEVGAMLALAPSGIVLPKASFSGAGRAATAGERRKRVILLAGCAQQVLRPAINDATIRLLARRGVDVEVVANAGCCGALLHHMGREEAALAMARQNIDAWTRAMDKGPPVDAVIINASGCGTTVKDYGHMLKRDAQYAEPAAKISGMTRDVTEFLAGYDLGPPQQWSRVRVAYHSACSMQHGQRVIQEPVQLLRNAGFSVVSVPEGHLCCGSAGTYNILQPEIPGQLRDRKGANIKSVRPDVVATGNIGCVAQLQSSLGVPIVHTVELLDWAYGGPAPRELESLATLVYEVPERRPTAAVT
mgnify:CR=1 FL=1